MRYLEYAAALPGEEWAAQWTTDREKAEQQVQASNARNPHLFRRLIERIVTVGEWDETA